MNQEGAEDVECEFTQPSQALRQEKREVTHSQLPGNVPASISPTQGWSCSAQPPPGISKIAVPIPKAGRQQFGVRMTLVGVRQSSGINPCFFRHAGPKEAAWGEAKGILFS